MFIPNRTCHIRRKGKNFTAYGEPQYGVLEPIRFALVRYDTKIEDSTVRADSSATRGNIQEYHASGRILVKPNVSPKWGDILLIEKKTFKIKEIEPRFNVLGLLDHYEIDFEKVEDVFGDTK